jgi:hypothetical protein
MSSTPQILPAFYLVALVNPSPTLIQHDATMSLRQDYAIPKTAFQQLERKQKARIWLPKSVAKRLQKGLERAE